MRRKRKRTRSTATTTTTTILICLTKLIFVYLSLYLAQGVDFKTKFPAMEVKVVLETLLVCKS